MSRLVLTDLVLQQFRKFEQPQRLTGLGPGLNLLSAPNEAGKSTLKAALDAVLFERHRLGGDAGKAFNNQWNDAPPAVHVGFSLDDAPYTLTKRFYRQHRAILCRPDGSVAEGDAAERELQTLLGFQTPERGSLKPELLGVWGLLWASQGDTIRPLDVGEAARTSLAECLVSGEVAAVTGGRRGSAVPAAVRTALAGYLTASTRRPTGRYKQLLDERESLGQTLADAEALRSALAEQTQALLLGRRDLNAERRSTDDEGERAAIRQLAAQLRDAQQLAEQVENGRLARTLADQTLAAAEEAVARRQAQIANAETLAAALAEADTQAAQANEKAASLVGALEKAQAVAADADDVAKTAKAEVERIACQRGLQERRTVMAREAERLRQALDAARQHQAWRTEAEALTCTPAALKRLRQLVQQHETALAARAAAATALRFTLSAEGAKTVTLDGQSVAADASIDLLQPASLSLGALGKLEIAPRVRDASALETELKEAESALAEAFAALAVPSLAAAEAQAEQRAQLLAKAQVSGERAQTLVPDATSAGDLAERLQQAETAAAEVAGTLDDADPRNDQTLDDADDQARAARTKAEAADETARTRWSEARQAHALAAQAAEHSAALAANARAAHTAASQALEAARAATPDDALAERVAAAAEARADAAAALAALQEKMEAIGTPERIAAQLERAEVARDRRRERIAKLEMSIARLEEQVRAQSDKGTDEAVAEARQSLDRVAMEIARIERDKDALLLLDRVLQEAASAAEARYLAPVTQHLRPYIDDLLGKAELELDTKFSPTGLRRAARQEAFPQLSAGTREQLSILTRLAFADVLAAQGRPVVLLLDDALLYCDDRRLESMFTALERAAERFQVIVFTCHARAFDGLGGRAQRRLEMVPADEIAL